jgi:hypothetical protein
MIGQRLLDPVIVPFACGKRLAVGLAVDATNDEEPVVDVAKPAVFDVRALESHALLRAGKGLEHLLIQHDRLHWIGAAAWRQTVPRRVEFTLLPLAASMPERAVKTKRAAACAAAPAYGAALGRNPACQRTTKPD